MLEGAVTIVDGGLQSVPLQGAVGINVSKSALPTS
jgi:hypothetical protein